MCYAEAAWKEGQAVTEGIKQTGTLGNPKKGTDQDLKQAKAWGQ
jgi:hypothetical protein